MSSRRPPGRHCQVMRKGKLIHLYCYEPLGLDRRAEQPWSDVYLNWTGKPGRTVYTLAPCIQGRKYLEHEIAWQEEYLERWGEDGYGSDAITADLAACRAVLAQLEAGLKLVGDLHAFDRMPEIQITEDWVTRASAERALAHLLWEVAGFDKVRFKWHRPKLIARPA